MSCKSRFTFVCLLTLAIGLLVCDFCKIAVAQQPNAQKLNQTVESAFAEARAACKLLWSDQAFDTLRTRIPLGDEKPTFSMLTNTQKLQSKEKPLADLAIKTLEKCRSAYAPVYAMLPPQVNSLIQGVERRQDDLIAKLYNGAITFGNFDVGMNDLNGKLSEALSGLPTQSRTSSTPPSVPQAVAIPKITPSVAAHATTFREKRLALVIGNSNYAKLPKLSNPTNDARSVAQVLQSMGYQTQLILDAPEDGVRSAVRKFASDSATADVALVYYAGHGAQLNGSNYLLPVDIDVPRTAADIQFSGLKVDDLVNSIGSNTKIIFLDACRDNPVLFKNIVAGRGSTPIGLAPASGSSFAEAKPGGGVFIAYATDAGAIADDGLGKHSPFTQALLRYMQKPMSIDDMFSLVTREVRLVTKNEQRPYKYASLESIVCLTPSCSTNASIAAVTDVVQEAKQSESDEFQIAVQTKNVDALETYLQKYPDTKQKHEILEEIAAMKRSEFTEWTLYEIGDQHNPQWIQISSITKFQDRATANTKQLVDRSKPAIINGKENADAAYVEDLNVYDCATPMLRIADESIFDKSGKVISHYKWADPQYLNLSLGTKLSPGSVGGTARNMVCSDEAATPLVSKEQIKAMNFTSLSSTVSGDGEIFYEMDRDDNDTQQQKKVNFIIRFNDDHSISDTLAQGTSIPDPVKFRTQIDHTWLKCDEDKYAFDRIEYWNASNELVRLEFLKPSDVKFSDFNPLSPFGNLRDIVCKKSYGGLGVRLAESEDGTVRVAEVFNGSPAEKAGIKANDIITQIDNASLGGLTIQQVVEKSRGAANTTLILTIAREGQDNPIKLTVTRENIQQQSTRQGGPNEISFIIVAFVNYRLGHVSSAVREIAFGINEHGNTRSSSY